MQYNVWTHLKWKFDLSYSIYNKPISREVCTLEISFYFTYMYLCLLIWDKNELIEVISTESNVSTDCIH